MVFGPCGGVRPDGGCEMLPAEPCVFDDAVVITDSSVAARPVRDVPLVVGDLSTPPYDPRSMRRAAEIMTPACDVLLVGEHHNRPDLPPTTVARTLLEAGSRPWPTLACRDRNRVVLEQELRGLQHVGVDTVLCVTGDGRGPDVRPGVTQVWDLDGPRLAALANETGLCAAVSETPTAPPTAARPARLVGKQRHGAAVALLNHVVAADDVGQFVRRARGLGLTIPVIAGVAVYTDAVSANALQGLPGLDLDRATVTAVLAAADPVAAGIDAAVTEALALLAVDGVVGVNLSGSATGRGWQPGAEIKAEIGRQLRAAA